jgi:hypothetical protein
VWEVDGGRGSGVVGGGGIMVSKLKYRNGRKETKKQLGYWERYKEVLPIKQGRNLGILYKRKGKTERCNEDEVKEKERGRKGENCCGKVMAVFMRKMASDLK